MASVGEKFKKARQNSGYTQSKLAEELGVSVSTIARWEHDSSSPKVKITNPGGIFNATMDDIMNGIQTYRNAHLVNVFDKLGLIENFGTGIPRTMSSYSEYTVKPVFQESTNYFIVTLPNVNYANDQINDQIDDRINDQR